MSIKTDREFIEELQATIVELEFELIPLKQQFEDWAEQNREYHVTASRRLALLERVLVEVFPTRESWKEILSDELISELARELKK